MRFYIIAGEASGDLHAANLVKELTLKRPDAVFRGLGGDLMQHQGVSLLEHYRNTAFMGFFEVMNNINKILAYIDQAKKDILSWKPDAIILVDYPGFNLRIAEFAKQKGFKVFYYISPQLWAWNASRVKKIKRDVDLMFVILPFEKDFYLKWEYPVEYVGHPLMDAVENFKNARITFDDDKPVIALLPGSRKQEILKMLPVMLSVRDAFPGHRFAIAAVNSIDKLFYSNLIGERKCDIVFNQTYALLSQSVAAVVTSGTATLETGLFNVPQVVCYKGSLISFWIGKKLVNVKYISLVNLIVDRPLVKELIQNDFTEANLKNELQELLTDDERRASVKAGYIELKEKIGGAGASAKTAMIILNKMMEPGK
jgi:lipid-A-disaccharide synthase